MIEIFHEVSGLLAQFTNALTILCAGVVLLFGILTISGMMWKTKLAIQQLASVNGPLVADESDGPGATLARASLRTIAGPSGGRSLVTESPDRILENWLQLHVLRLARFEAGGWLTGMALFFTFFLIALVLTNHVGPAVAGQSANNMAHLSDAVRTMGTKFVVSMLGIAVSILHGFVRAHCVRNLHAAVGAAAYRLRTFAISVADYQVECAEWQVENGAALHRTIQHQHAEMNAQLQTIRESILSLSSIEVSVQDIGTNLSNSLQKMVKHDLVEGLRRELQEIVDNLAKALSDSFSSSLNHQIANIVEALQRIEGAVAGQAHSQVEDLLTKLSDLVSGGFASESSRMKDVLTRFSEAIPALEAQVRAMARSASEDLAQRSAESDRANAIVFERLGTMLESMERQHRGTAEVSAQMQQFIMESQSLLTDSVASANEQFSSRSQAAVQQISEAMQAATKSAADGYRSLVSGIEAAAATVQQARADAMAGAGQLHEATQQMREPMQRMGTLITGLQGVLNTFSASVQQARSTVEDGAAALRTSRETVAQHQRFIEELTARWPQLTQQYIETSDRAFNKVASHWKTHADAIGTHVSRMGEAFSSSALEFADAVQELGDQLRTLYPDKAAPVSSRPRG